MGTSVIVLTIKIKKKKDTLRKINHMSSPKPIISKTCIHKI